jgi:hypothetical protein
MEEIIKCPTCKKEYSLLYSDELVVSQTKHCQTKNIDKHIREIKNYARAIKVTRPISKTNKTNTKKQS